MDGGAVECTPFRRPGHEQTRHMFNRWLEQREGGGLPLVHLIESLLFLSMVPLHADRPRSQLAFLTRGLELFEEAAGASDYSRIEVFSHAGVEDEHPHYHGR